MLRLGNDKDKFGYYRVGDYKTYSKVEAIELSRRVNKFPDWIFNDLEFGAYDWRVEPQETLSELYRRRAQQIRDNYDYVVIMYSGGADSNNMLDSFVDNGIAFDEIATLNYWQADDDRDSYFNAELFKVAYPRIKLLQSQGLDFHHRPIDLSEISARALADDALRLDRAYLSSSHWGTVHFSKSYLREDVADYRRIIESGRKLVFVWGGEKPRVFVEQGRFCTRFLDQLDHCVPTRTQIVNREWEYDELFYWSPDCVDMLCKQAHVLRRFIKQQKINLGDNHDIDRDMPGMADIFGCRHISVSYRNLVNKLVYPKFTFDLFSMGKRFSVIYNPIDEIFWSDQHWKSHTNLLEQHLEQLDPYWHNDSHNIDKGLVGHVSQPYFLE